MPAYPNALERVLFATNVAPSLVTDFTGAGLMRVLRGALALGVFEALATQPRSAADLAGQCNADPRATGMLLETLARGGYVRRAGDAYANTPLSAKWLTEGGSGQLHKMVRFSQDLVFPFVDAHLEEVLRNGRPALNFYQWMDQEPARWRLAQEWFEALARMAGDEIATKARLPAGSERVLDLGGGHGWYSVALCRRYPGLDATVLDLPKAMVMTPEVVRGAGMEAHVHLREGDYTRDDLGEGWDAALLFNVLHAHSPAECRALFRHVADALRPGGVLLIQDQFPGVAPGPAFKAAVQVIGFNYLMVLGGQIHAYEGLARALRAAGFGEVRRMALRSVPGSTLVRAVRAS